jgi:NTP pyrophosphatase (non-canonical NTP hydrolase)
MSKPEFQQKVGDFVAETSLETNVQSRLLDLVSELGEVAKEVLKGSQYGREPFSPTIHWENELADAFFSLICLANSTGVNLDTALDQVLEKYRGRLSARGDAGSDR